MHTRLLWCGAFILCLLGGVAQGQLLRPQIDGQTITEGPFPKPNPVFAGGVRALPDLPYARAGTPHPLTLDLYLPPGPPSTPRPLVVYVHGGDWNSGSTRASGVFANWPAALASLAARGFVVASIDYRRANEAPFPAQILDVKDAIRWLRSKAGDYGIDRARVAVWGAEAGGQLAALAAASCGAPAFERPAAAVPPNPAIGPGQRPPVAADESACVQAAVVWSGVSDFFPLREMAAANAFLGCTGPVCDPQRRLASPVTYVDANAPPFLIVHGMEDTFIPESQAARLNAIIQNRGGRSVLVLLPGVGRGFIGATPDATAEASQRAWQRTVDFLEQMLGPAGR
ncbi:MAG: alpha/beta hydrolase fold domain-containing protein [Telluria sp.]